MPSAADQIASAIADGGGAIRFDRFMDLALYGEHGFYSVGGSAGRRGDFITSPEVGPLFGAVLARWIEAQFVQCGSPDSFQVIEIGAGPGTLARSVLAHWARTGGHRFAYTAVEVSAAQRAAHPVGITSIEAMPVAPLTGVVIANEVLDNLPMRLLVFDGEWREAFVAGNCDRFVEVLQPLDDPPPWLPSSAGHGARVPWQQRALEWVEATRARIEFGAIVAFDYVTPRTADLAAVPWRQWLRTYRGHQRGAHYLADVGRQDITAQLALDQLPEPQLIRTQAQFLRRWGIDELVDEGRGAWSVASAAPTVAAMTMRSRVREAEALLDPAGLGGFVVLEWAGERPHSYPGG